MFWRDKKRPSPPPVEQEQQFVEWLLRHGREFEIYRKIYKRDIEKYVKINKQAVLKELTEYPNKEALSSRLGKISDLYVEEFLPLVEKEGGVFFLDSQSQAYVAMFQIKVQAFHYILKYKYQDKITIAQESVCGPLEDIYSE